MPQKAYKRRPPRSVRRAEAKARQQNIQRRSSARGFSLPRSFATPYDPISVVDPQAPEVKLGRVSARSEVEALGKVLHAPVMHVLFIDRHSGSWMRIDWPED